MGAKLTVLENRTYYNIEMRLWVYPSRPDRFNKVIRVGLERSITIDSKHFRGCDRGHGRGRGRDLEETRDEAALVMVYANGAWTGKYILPISLMTKAKVICDRNKLGQVILRGERGNFSFCRSKFIF